MTVAMPPALIFTLGAAFGSMVTATLVWYWYDRYLYRRMIAMGWRWVYKGIPEYEA